MTKSELCTFGLTSIVLLGGGACTPPMDHFRVYLVQEVPVQEQVRLTDQFDPNAKEARLEALTHFANPSRKVAPAGDEGIKDGNRHLNWYRLNQQVPEPRRTIRFRNQFGQHSVDTRDPRFLAVPAQKTSDRNSSFPDSLDHYKCYGIININTAPPLPVVTVGDQFNSQANVQVGDPRLFCLPVRKEREGESPQGIKNSDDHFAVYDMPPQADPRTIQTRDQFRQRPLQVIRSVWLAVPTEKQAVVAHNN